MDKAPCVVGWIRVEAFEALNFMMNAFSPKKNPQQVGSLRFFSFSKILEKDGFVKKWGAIRIHKTCLKREYSSLGLHLYWCSGHRHGDPKTYWNILSLPSSSKMSQMLVFLMTGVQLGSLNLFESDQNTIEYPKETPINPPSNPRIPETSRNYVPIICGYITWLIWQFEGALVTWHVTRLAGACGPTAARAGEGCGLASSRISSGDVKVGQMGCQSVIWPPIVGNSWFMIHEMITKSGWNNTGPMVSRKARTGKQDKVTVLKNDKSGRSPFLA